MASSAAARKPAAAATHRDALAFVTDEATREAIARAMRDANLPGASIIDGGIGMALKQVEPGVMPRFLLVDVATSSTPVADVAALAAVMEPGTKLIVIGATNDVALFRDLLGVGAADYLVKPLDAQLLHAALAETGTHVRHSHSPAKLGRVAAFVGARGGAGSTTLAVNAAWLLAHERKQKTALIDLDLHFGTAALSLDLEPGRGLREAMEHPGRIDSLFMERAMAKIGDRLFVLGCEEPLREHPAVDPAALEILLGEIRQNFSWVVLDMPRSMVSTQAKAFSAITDLMLVCDQSLAGIRDTMRILDFIKESAPHTRVKLLSTSVDGTRPKIRRAEFEKSIGRKLDYEVPFDPKTVSAGANAGKPLIAVERNGKLVKIVRQMTVDLVGNDDKAKSGFFRRWMRK
jgi:pilus assembly protein CpaE